MLGFVTLVTGWWLLIAVLAVQLILGLALGRRYCLPCVFYFEVVQPRIGEGPIDDARPHRFANVIGASFLTAASVAHAVGFESVGRGSTAIVAALALLAAATGLCVGCEMYRLIGRVRGIRPGGVTKIDLAEIGASPHEQLIVGFTHPLCTACKALEQRLAREGRHVVLVDVSKRADLARKYHVSIVPTALVVSAEGAVLERIA